MRTVPPKSKHEILQRAIPMFAESGFKGVTMRAIAGRVGLTAASLYHHFPDKESLYLAALKQAFADRSRALGEALTAPAAAEACMTDSGMSLGPWKAPQT